MIYNQVLLHNQHENKDNNKPYNTISIIDWDDTLLSSSHLYPYLSGLNSSISEQDKNDLKLLEQEVVKLLEYCVSRGDTYIVTNSAIDWVKSSSRYFMPEVLKILPKINIQSARSNFEEEFPDNHRKWKINTFLSIKEKYSKEKILNVVCIGDSINELEAAFKLKKEFVEAFIKTIKMQTRPSIVELYKELKVLNKSTEKIFDTVKSLVINVDRKIRVVA